MKTHWNGTALTLMIAMGAGLLPAHATTDSNSNAIKIDELNREVQDLSNQIRDLKRSQNAQYTDLRNKSEKGVQISLKNGRPTFSTADGNFSVALRALVQYDSAYYAQGHAPASVDFSSGNNFRRARFGIDGTLFKDWSYEFIFDFGGSATEGGGHIHSAYIQYDGLKPVHIKVGAFPPPESFEDSTSSSDIPFLERAQPADLARGIAGASGRDSATVFAYDEDYFAALSYTGGVVGASAVFDEQQALVGRFAYRLFHDGESNLALGGNATYVFSLADAAPGAGSPNPFRLRERPELNVDSSNTRLIDTGTIDASKVWQWGVEAAGNWHSLYAQGGYFGFNVTRRVGTLLDPSLYGWYAQASWVLTGEAKAYRAEKGAYTVPKPNDPFSFDHAGIGAWEIAARYSVLDLNDNPGIAGLPTPVGGIRGGYQKIWTVGLNWYPNDAIRFLLDYQHTDVSRLDAAGADIGAKLDAVSLRAQLSL